MSPDGRGKERLTITESNNEYPAWSPDSTQIAFVSDVDGNSEIYVMEASGLDLRRVTFQSATDTHPTWSPDGQRIAFASDRGGNFDIFLVNVDGSGLTRVTSNRSSDTSPSWLPIPLPPAPPPPPADTTAPFLTIQNPQATLPLTPDQRGSTRTVTVRCSDVGSGCDSIEYLVAGAGVTQAGVITVPSGVMDFIGTFDYEVPDTAPIDSQIQISVTASDRNFNSAGLETVNTVVVPVPPLNRDVDGDGVSDFIVGAPSTEPGAAYVFSGATGSLIYRIEGLPRDEFQGKFFGASEAMAGDLNADSRGDFLVGDTFVRTISAFSGADGSLIYQVSGIIADLGDRSFGESLSAGKDVDGDGTSDFITGGHLAQHPSSSDGSAWVFSGSDGSLIHRLDGESGEHYGRSVALLDDINGDGKSEFIVGATHFDFGDMSWAGQPFTLGTMPASCSRPQESSRLTSSAVASPFWETSTTMDSGTISLEHLGLVTRARCTFTPGPMGR